MGKTAPNWEHPNYGCRHTFGSHIFRKQRDDCTVFLLWCGVTWISRYKYEYIRQEVVSDGIFHVTAWLASSVILHVYIMYQSTDGLFAYLSCLSVRLSSESDDMTQRDTDKPCLSLLSQSYWPGVWVITVGNLLRDPVYYPASTGDSFRKCKAEAVGALSSLFIRINSDESKITLRYILFAVLLKYQEQLDLLV
jgi:hypothetical protein